MDAGTGPFGRVAIYALTPQGAGLGARLAQGLPGDLFLPETQTPALGNHDPERTFTSLSGLVARTFRAYAGHVFLTACGIAVRVIAPLLGSKDRDPAVVVVDQAGEHAISLVSGHLGRANELTRRVAAILGGRAVITTATDVSGLTAIDLLAAERGLAIGNLAAGRGVSAALLRGETVQVRDPEARLGWTPGAEPQGYRLLARDADWRPGAPGVWVSWRLDGPESGALLLHPRCLAAGAGCRRGTPAGDILGLVREVLTRYSLALPSLRVLASIEAKRDEAGLLEAARQLGAITKFYPAQELDAVAVPNPSATVRKHMGVDSVCEAAALLAAGTTTLLAPKTGNKTATLAVALDACPDA